MREQDLEICAGLVIPDDEIAESASRASGPGGQHVNKTNTRVTLRWSVRDSRALSEDQRERLLEGLAGRLTGAGELIVSAERTRSRSRNRDHARRRIAEIVAESLEVVTPRVPTRASRSSRSRVRADKARRGSLKKQRSRVSPSHED